MADDPAVVERGVLTAAAERWDLAVRRAGVIGQLAGRSTVGLAAAEAAAAELGVSRRRVYVLIGRVAGGRRPCVGSAARHLQRRPWWRTAPG
jgi:putative transposase